MSQQILELLKQFELNETNLNLITTMFQNFPQQDHTNQILEICSKTFSYDQLHSLSNALEQYYKQKPDQTLFEELSTVLEDSSDLLNGEQMFIAGLLVGRSHGKIQIQEIIDMFVKMNKLDDQELKKEIQLKMLCGLKLQEIKQSLNDNENSMDIDQEYEDSTKLVAKELQQLNPNINELLGRKDACEFKQELAQSEIARIELEKQLNDEKQKFIMQLQVNDQLYKQKEQEQKDIELAQKLQKEIQDQKVKEEQKNQAENQCKFCNKSFFNQINDDIDLITLDNCRHVFHNECIQKYVIQQKQAQEIPIFECPINNCKKPINKTQIESLLNAQSLAKGERQKYVVCFTPDCPYVAELPKIEQKELWNSQFDCPICEASFCLNCKKENHPGRKCDHVKLVQPQLQPEYDIIKRSCPRCKFIVTGKLSSKKLYCRCGMEFCWECEQQICQCQDIQIQNVKKCPCCDHRYPVDRYQRLIYCQCGISFCSTCNKQYCSCPDRGKGFLMGQGFGNLEKDNKRNKKNKKY